MSNKRGRPRLRAEKSDTMIGVRVTPSMADQLFQLAHRTHTDVSTITRQYYDRLLSSNENCPKPTLLT